jgi:hypothetical protein
MPNLANITVKKFDAITDIVWTGVNAASGLDNPAIFRSNTVGSAVAHKPELRVNVKNNGVKDRVVATFKYPQIATNSTTGVTSVIGTVDGKFEFTADKATDQTVINEASAQFMNLLASALIKQAAAERTNIV